MYTQCPGCRKAYEISKEQLLENNLISCEGCSTVFNAFDFLSDSIPVEKKGANTRGKVKRENKPKSKPRKKTKAHHQSKTSFKPEPTNNKPNEISASPVVESVIREPLPWEIEKTPININWHGFAAIGILLLLAQFIFFESKHLSQNASYRPTLEIITKWMGLALPVYENISELEVLQGTLNTTDDGNLWFKAAFNNQAAFGQRLPNVKLTLLDNDGQVFAERIFVPDEYLSTINRATLLIAPDETLQASLRIANPKTSIGGYHFDLTYEKQ